MWRWLQASYLSVYEIKLSWSYPRTSRWELLSEICGWKAEKCCALCRWLYWYGLGIRRMVNGNLIWYNTSLSVTMIFTCTCFQCHHDGGCIRKRSAECRNGSNQPVPEYFCIADFMVNTERCADSACDKSRWNYTVWSEVNKFWILKQLDMILWKQLGLIG